MFPPTSRYYNIETAKLVGADGRETIYLRRRFLPDLRTIIVLAEHSVTEGDRLVVRSRVICTGLGVPLYGKIQILSFQDSTVTFQVLADKNCGYKDLLPGLPAN